MFFMQFFWLKWKTTSCQVLKDVAQLLKDELPVYRQGRNFYFLKEKKNAKVIDLNHTSSLKPLHLGHVALLWNGSYLFGLMTFWQLKKLGIPCSVITAEEIKQGILEKHHLLLVPGGWSGPKSEALGEKGKKEIRKFVRQGGNYLGICGGAGLALSDTDGLGLLPIKRKKDRGIANFYGKIVLKQTTSHPLWEGIPNEAPFNVWWPALFEVQDKKAITILGTYSDISPEFFVADLNILDLKKYSKIQKWEEQYQVNIDPGILKNQPALLEGKYDQGKVVLTYPHLDTPDNPWEALALFNLYHSFFNKPFAIPTQPLKSYEEIPKYVLKLIKKLKMAMEEFFQFGQRNFLWYWYKPWMLRWRKGIRGFHYLTLYLLIKEINRYTHKKPVFVSPDLIIPHLETLVKIVLPFLEKAKSLLLKERYLLNTKPLSLISTDNKELNILRQELFGETPAYGGKFKQILCYADKILVPFLKAEANNIYSKPR
ncbi:MAG TPA: hypothetical protein ENJ03_05595 [Candidatus Desulfofervidus auxilii]|uniref:Biotin-protein ligase N-terminal domain-containing protein n=1 Tax=Desulfofervidus auxilii TaxID=1621989 RepID=A0A7V1I5P8_DESA2|nr:hypothetical protein [Candidatus Desulfofervidus auxilii]